MLPQHAAKTPVVDVSRYIVRSSDVISDMRVNVLEENSDKVVWYKERFLFDNEIVDHLVDSHASTICWTIHRPKRGWYIKIRSPSFPPGVSIPVVPVRPDSPYHAEAALSFSCRTDIARPKSLGSSLSSATPLLASSTETTLRPTQPEASCSTAIHSYPPTPPPAVLVQPPSPRAVHAKLDELDERKKKPSPRLALTRISEFILAPLSTSPTSTLAESFFARALSAFRGQQSSTSNSFTLSLLPPSSPLSPPPPYAPNTPFPISHSPSSSAPSYQTRLLTFHDRTPLLTVHAITGMLEIDKSTERMLGVQSSFLVAVALTYLDFLEDRQSYLAATSD